jgi:polyphosphate glucokinase
VDVGRGVLLAPRLRVRTPRPATPDAVAGRIAEITAHFRWKGLVGCGFPAVVQRGRVRTAANVSAEWIGVDGRAILEQATGGPVVLANDADVAGVAEMRFGAGRGRTGTVLVVTLGTGIGTALFVDGRLVPNTELGHIELRGRDAETRAAESVRVRKDLSWKKWAQRVDEYLERVCAYVWPELVIVGGGVSQEHARFLPLLSVGVEVVPAQLRNDAGIVGAAVWAAESIPATHATRVRRPPRPRRPVAHRRR